MIRNHREQKIFQAKIWQSKRKQSGQEKLYRLPSAEMKRNKKSLFQINKSIADDRLSPFSTFHFQAKTTNYCLENAIDVCLFCLIFSLYSSWRFATLETRGPATERINYFRSFEKKRAFSHHFVKHAFCSISVHYFYSFVRQQIRFFWIEKIRKSVRKSVAMMRIANEKLFDLIMTIEMLRMCLMDKQKPDCCDTMRQQWKTSKRKKKKNLTTQKVTIDSKCFGDFLFSIFNCNWKLIENRIWPKQDDRQRRHSRNRYSKFGHKSNFERKRPFTTHSEFAVGRIRSFSVVNCRFSVSHRLALSRWLCATKMFSFYERNRGVSMSVRILSMATHSSVDFLSVMATEC